MGFLILAAPSDRTATAVAALLTRRRGATEVQLRTPDEIVLAPYWEHRVSRAGANTEIRMHDGGSLAGFRPAVVLNRISRIELPQFARASAADRDYAQTEMCALLISWLASAGCRVVNPPSAAALSGCFHRPVAWHRLAARAGLATLMLTATSGTRRFRAAKGLVPRPELSWQRPDSAAGVRLNGFSWFSEPVTGTVASVLVVGSRVLGDMAPAVHDRCLRLARLAGADLLRIDFARSLRAQGDCIFIGADPCPVVTDAPGVSALADFLESAATSAWPAVAP